ncbi:MAG: hypothetical protein GQ583_06670 [Methyloprofundus sp.]|nr:hypothetical protein [Methyloprofundus sp.]
MPTQNPKVKEANHALQQAVAKALAKKKKLGEFAIVSRDDLPYQMPANELPDEPQITVP